MNVKEPGRKRTLLVALTLLVGSPGLCLGQVSGNAAYGQMGGKARAAQSERNKRVLAQNDLPPTRNSMFVEASVLMNVKADEYVAVFGITQEGSTLADCSQKMDATVTAFANELKPM